ncbi:type II CRISPR RNA-guided endonuclease Cas9 [Tissierella praeacuta]|uniref:type II CRISPR RNA-guided endonuclease Cas9 n=2 Tax=Tissierella praeacuta TaxID=43131 RepID=UPI0035197291
MEKKKYNIGLDIGTNSVGWAVTNENAHLMKYKGKNIWGVRLFEKGDTAAARRGHRSTRRRLARRKQRVNQLQEIFASEISKIDENFFIRLKESFLHTEDSSTLSPSILFDDRNYSDKDYHREYPTIYHLRKELMDSKEKMDIRLIYLTLHHILKYRGNFLYGKGDFGKVGDNIDECLEYVFSDLFINDDYNISDIDVIEIKNILSSTNNKANKQELLQKLLSNKDKNINNKIKELIKAILGYKFSLVKLFELEDSEQISNKSFKEEIDEAEIESMLGEKTEAFESLRSIYNWVTLEELLGDIETDDLNDKTISNAMITKYNNHEKQLKMLKELIKDICPKEYNNIFRKEGNDSSYPNYIKNTRNHSLENLNKYIKKILDKYPLAKEHRYYIYIYELLEENRLLAKLNTTDNSVIPYQLQKIEMERIIDSQGQYYPFLAENKTLLIKILESRIPYYVGPLNRNSEFAWHISLENSKKSGKIYPWNYENYIDIDSTAEEFIKRMTNKCTYLREEDVLPRYSLLYSEFVLLNELNKVKIRINGKIIDIDKNSKKEIIENIFKTQKTVKVSDIVQWVRKNPNGFITKPTDDIIVEGTQQENEFAASLSSYYDFKKIFGKIDDSNIKMIEEIISWITIFEDKEILKRKIKGKYKLNKNDIEKIMKLKYSGWARLSKKLIDGIRTQTSEWTGNTIIDIMRNTNYNFMQIINDSRFDFKEIIDELNPINKKERLGYEDIKELQGSPAIKRGIWETVKIIDEIVNIMGAEPENIFIEFARSDEVSKRTTSRTNRMKVLYDEIRKDVDLYNEEVYKTLQNCIKSKDKLDNKALYLYFTQNGKCMYTGKSLNPDDLSKYEIDHIIPRSYIKDDSIDNLVLVIPEANQDKKDRLILGPEIQRRQGEYWNNLYKYGLISRKKYDNLTRGSIPDREIIGFINRQLVETRQISKHISDLLSEVYEDTKIISIKARLTSDYREQYDLYKNRDVNDYHHAHDALIVSVIGKFIINRYPYLEDEVNIKKYIKWFKTTNMHKDNKNKYGFILASMNQDYSSDGFIWAKDDEIVKVKKALSYKDCFVTKKVEEQTGKFYDETIYAHNHPKAKIPIKKGLDPKKYGGYSGVQNAYYVVIEYMKGKKKIRKMISIPISEAQSFQKTGLDDYIAQLENIDDVSTLRILKNNIKRYQLIEYQGQNVYLINEGEQQNATQLIVDDKYKEMLYKISENKIVSAEKDKDYYEKIMIEFFDYFVEKLVNYYPLYIDLAKNIKESRKDFIGYEFNEKVRFIRELLLITQAKSSYGKFKSFNTKIKNDDAGRIRKVWKIEDVIFIDRSITGLFERRYKL